MGIVELGPLRALGLTEDDLEAGPHECEPGNCGHEPQHTFTVRYKVIGRSFYEQLAEWAGLDDDHDDEHDWIDTSCFGSSDYEYICSGCGITKTEPRIHWPLYPAS